jgi:uncharacterized protein YfbU (UPF0304 family)
MQALNERIELRLDQDTIHGVDAWRAKQPGVPSRSEAIRQLIDRALRNTAQPENFSKGEALLVAMLGDIYKTLKIKSDFDPEFLRDALGDGHHWAIESEYSGFFHEPIDIEKVEEVGHWLLMWQTLELTLAKLSKADSARFDESVSPYTSKDRFPGFDGNHEGEYSNVARFLVERMGQFPHFKGRVGLNSHSHTLEIHRRMYEVFERAISSSLDRELRVEDLIEVYRARIHPLRRT